MFFCCCLYPVPPRSSSCCLYHCIEVPTCSARFPIRISILDERMHDGERCMTARELLYRTGTARRERKVQAVQSKGARASEEAKSFGRNGGKL
jgi:hypothetical protein